MPRIQWSNLLPDLRDHLFDLRRHFPGVYHMGDVSARYSGSDAIGMASATERGG